MTKQITKFEFENLKKLNHYESKNGYTTSTEYRVNWKNEVVCDYYFNDGQIIDTETVIGVYVER